MEPIRGKSVFDDAWKTAVDQNCCSARAPRISISDRYISRQLNEFIHPSSIADYPALRVTWVLEPIPPYVTARQDACLSRGQDKRSRIRALTEVAPPFCFLNQQDRRVAAPPRDYPQNSRSSRFRSSEVR